MTASLSFTDNDQWSSVWLHYQPTTDDNGKWENAVKGKGKLAITLSHRAKSKCSRREAAS